MRMLANTKALSSTSGLQNGHLDFHFGQCDFASAPRGRITKNQKSAQCLAPQMLHLILVILAAQVVLGAYREQTEEMNPGLEYVFTHAL